MSQATVNGTTLFYTEAGSGEAIIFVHEFAGDHRSWELQMRFFSRRYHCISYNARGYPPSAVPDDAAVYSQQHQTDDIVGILDHLKLEKAHVIGLSMGSFAALHFGLRYPQRSLSLVLAATGYGALPDSHDLFAQQALTMADRIEQQGITDAVDDYAGSPFRLPFKYKDPRGWQEFASHLAHHDSQGAYLTLRGYQATRPAFTELEQQLKHMSVPVLIIAGDEDDPSLAASLYLKQTIPSAALSIFPKTGHAMNLEEPALFNATVQSFIDTVSVGRWQARTPLAAGKVM